MVIYNLIDRLPAYNNNKSEFILTIISLSYRANLKDFLLAMPERYCLIVEVGRSKDQIMVSSRNADEFI